MRGQCPRGNSLGPIQAIIFLAISISCSTTSEDTMAPSFADDLRFLEEYSDVILLKDAKEEKLVAVVPKWQGRVMTSTNSGMSGLSFGWINYELIESREILPHINVFGGEDRFWMGPEGGQFAIFFEKASSFDLESWQTPTVIDTEAFDVEDVAADAVSFSRSARISNYSGTEFQLKIDRTVRLLDDATVALHLGSALPDEISVVCFESVNGLTNTGQNPWSKEGGLLSIWILGMYIPSPATTVIIPFEEGPEEDLGPIVNDAYFGKIPSDRLKVLSDVILFKADGKYRGKIGLSPRRAKSVLGSWDAKNEVLTIVQYTKPVGVLDYVNSMWEIQDEPFLGDTVNSYNDGPPAPGAKPLGPFYELETSSPAVELGPNETVEHIHRTFHFTGPVEELDELSRTLFGIGLEEANL